ncbi:MAG: hypothetical protein IJW83_04230 [Clostridia bacterium]|nr:hypothetical protein [Clostridia bacterium]
MATSAYTYDALLQTMKNRFTVVQDNCEYTLGGYMRTKAAERTKGQQLPATIVHKAPVAVRHFLTAVNEKLKVKEVPPPEKALTAFPLRTVFSSLAAAFVLCTLVFSFARIGLASTSGSELPALQTAESQVEIVSQDDMILPYETYEERL